MPLPTLVLPVAISAIRMLLQWSKKADVMLSVSTAAEELPFVLPAIPDVNPDDAGRMRAYFAKPANKPALEVLGLIEAFEQDAAFDPAADTEALIRAYYAHAGVHQNVPALSADRSDEDRLAYLLVNSHRLTSNPTAVRLLIMTTQTLAAFVGEQAPLLLANGRVQRLLGTFFVEYSQQEHLDDATIGTVLRRLLGAAITSAVEHQQDLPEHPALAVLYTALEEVRQQRGNDFVATIITRDGFQDVVHAYVTQAAANDNFLEVLAGLTGLKALDDGHQQLATWLRKGLAGLLTAIGEQQLANLDDPAAFIGVLEGTLRVLAAHASPVLRAELGDEALLAAVLESVARQIAQEDVFARAGTGALFGALFKTSLATIAARPQLLQQHGLNETVADLVSGVARSLATVDFGGGIAADEVAPLLHDIAAHGLSVLAEQPRFLRLDHALAAEVAGDTMAAAASLVRDGLEMADVVELVRTAVETASSHLHLVDADHRVREALASFGTTIAREAAFTRLRNPRDRKALLLEAFAIIADNPAIWKRFAAHQMVQPVVSGLLRGLATAPEDVLTGAVMVSSVRSTLAALTRAGMHKLAEDDLDEQIRDVLTTALDEAHKAIGTGIDGETLPVFLARVVRAFLLEALEGIEPEALARAATASDKARLLSAVLLRDLNKVA
jgi:hypothetical protein